MNINPWREVYDCKESKDPWNNPPEFALYLDVELTNYCNFKCAFCVGQQQGQRSRGYMDLEMFKEICYQAKIYGALGIRLLRWGEPMMHPNFLEMVDIAKKHNLLVHVTTNGSLLEKVGYDNIIDSKLDSLIISFQGTCEKEYKKLRKKDYNDIVSKIIKLRNVRDNRGVNNPYITLSTTVTDETKEEINRFKENWLRVVDGVSIGYTCFKRLKDQESVKDYLSRKKILPHLFKCQEVMVKLSIDWDGTVSPCCLDYDQQLSVGNIKDSTLYELWHSDDTKSIRTLLTNKRQDMFSLCQTCELNYDFRGKI